MYYGSVLNHPSGWILLCGFSQNYSFNYLQQQYCAYVLLTKNFHYHFQRTAANDPKVSFLCNNTMFVCLPLNTERQIRVLVLSWGLISFYQPGISSDLHPVIQHCEFPASLHSSFKLNNSELFHILCKICSLTIFPLSCVNMLTMTGHTTYPLRLSINC